MVHHYNCLNFRTQALTSVKVVVDSVYELFWITKSPKPERKLVEEKPWDRLIKNLWTKWKLRRKTQESLIWLNCYPLRVRWRKAKYLIWKKLPNLVRLRRKLKMSLTEFAYLKSLALFGAFISAPGFSRLALLLLGG